MKFLLSGATGFLGSHLVKALLEGGHELIILKRSFSDTRRLVEELPSLAVYNLDCSSLEQPFQDHAKVDAVIHTATCYGRQGEGVADIFEANTLFPLRLLIAAVAAEVKLFLNIDTSLPRDLNPYSMSKKQFAEWGQYFAQHGEINFINAAMEHFYGPGDNPDKFITYVVGTCLRNDSELPLTFGEQKRDFVYIDDAVSAIKILIREGGDSAGFKQFEIGSGEAVSIRHLVQTIRRLANSSTHLAFGALPYRKNELIYKSAHIDPLCRLGWRPEVSLFDGIRKTIEEERGRLL